MPGTTRGTDDLAELRQELWRLKRLREHVAEALLEISKSAQHDAETLLAETDGAGLTRPTQNWLYASFAGGLVCGLVIAAVVASLLDQPESPTAGVAVGTTGEPLPPPSVMPREPSAPSLSEPVDPIPGPGSEARPQPSPEMEGAPSAERVPRGPETSPPGSLSNDGLIVTLVALGPCWVRTEVDDDAPVERMLALGDRLVLEADHAVGLRIGDAGAVTLTINDQPTLPLGGAGQVTSLQITAENYQDFLRN